MSAQGATIAGVDNFAVGEHVWIERLGNLRNAVRQELIGRQLEAHVPDDASVLDVGCGQGTQAIRLARRGCTVVGVDPSAELLGRLAADAQDAGVHVVTHQGRIDDIPTMLGHRTFGVVCAHGLLMYLDDPDVALATLAARLAPTGLLSITFRNGAALAFRPGMRRRWQDALDAFDAHTYVNELGIDAHAHRLEDMSLSLFRLGLAIDTWYGVRVFTEPASGDEPVDESQFDSLLRAEEQAGCRDPYRQLASQSHLIARPLKDRPASTVEVGAEPEPILNATLEKATGSR